MSSSLSLSLSVPLPPLPPHTHTHTLVSLYVCSKLKKMYRTMQEEKGKQRAACGAEAQEQGPRRPKQQFDKDFALEPFEGTCPEYMEMSEYPSLGYAHTADKGLHSLL